MSKLLPSVVLNKNFLKLWLAQVTSQIALNAIYFILTIKVYDLTHSNTAVSVLILTFTVPSIFLGYLAGVWVDQLSLKKVMLLTNSFRSAVVLLLLIFFNNIGLLFLLVLLLAVATLFFVPAEGSSIPALVNEKDLLAANSLFSLTLQTAIVVGFLAGGFSLGLFGLHWTLLFILIFFIVSLVLNVLLPDKIQVEERTKTEGMLVNFWKGIAFVVKTKIVRDSVFFLTLTTTIVFILATIGPGYVDKILGLNINYAAAFVIAPATVGMALGSLFLGHFGHRQDQRRLVNIGLLSMGLTFFVLAFLGGNGSSGLFRQITALFFILLLGVENALITIPVTTDFQKNTPEELRGRAYGLLSTFISGVAALPVLISGALADLFSVRSVLIYLGAVVLFFGLFRLRGKPVI